jgi:hypothetical protein
MKYNSDLFKPDSSDYETTPEGWALYSEQQKDDINDLREMYPELSDWRDIERMNAWGAFCYDYEFTTWSEPYRTHRFLYYLQLGQDALLPDCDNDREAIYVLLQTIDPGSEETVDCTLSIGMSGKNLGKESVPFGWDVIEPNHTFATVAGTVKNSTELGNMFVSPRAFEALKQDLTHLRSLEPEVDADDYVSESDSDILNDK